MSSCLCHFKQLLIFTAYISQSQTLWSEKIEHSRELLFVWIISIKIYD